jgi:hypothetical protein
VKSESERLQEERTTARIAELQNSAEKKKVHRVSKSGGGGSSVTSRHMTKRRHDLSQTLHQDDPDSVSQRLDLEQKMVSTAAKRNITSRKSRDRHENPSRKSLQGLVSKRPQERSKDRLYGRDSGNWEDLKLSKKPVFQNPLDLPTPKPNSPVVTTFLKRDILALKDEPNGDTFDSLMALYSERLNNEEKLQEARHDQNGHEIAQYQLAIQECDSRMHEVYLNYLQNKEEFHSASSGSDSEESTVRSHSPAHVGELDHAQMKSMTGQEWCPPSQNEFTIYFEYKDSTTDMGVWDTMPVRRVFLFAYDWIVREWDVEISYESMMLLLQPNVPLTDQGFLFEVPIVEGDTIEIQLDLRGNRRKPISHHRPQPRKSLSPDSRGGRAPRTERHEANDKSGLDSKSYDRIRQNFKCPKFSGKVKDWKSWDQGLKRYLSIWELDHVLDPDFFSILPLDQYQSRDNKLVYYILEEAVQQSSLAASYVRKAPLKNGFEAYYTLLDGFVFTGATNASLLLNELTGFRFLSNEMPTALVLRLKELFQDLETLPDDAAMRFNDTQKIGYLLNALRHEAEWKTVHSALVSRQIKGDITFAEACDELKVRCEASRSNDLIDRPITSKAVKIGAATTTVLADVNDPSEAQIFAYISTQIKKRNLSKKSVRLQLPCLANECDELTSFPLCGGHYHAVVASKTPSLALRNNYGFATFDPSTNLIVYPDKVPSDRLPSNVKRPSSVKVKAAQRTSDK